MATTAELETQLFNLTLRVQHLEAELANRRFKKPTKEEVLNYFCEKLDEFSAMAQADLFYTHYEARGWKMGNTKMANWKAAINSWLDKKQEYAIANRSSSNGATNKIGTSEARQQAARNYGQPTGNRA